MGKVVFWQRGQAEGPSAQRPRSGGSGATRKSAPVNYYYIIIRFKSPHTGAGADLVFSVFCGFYWEFGLHILVTLRGCVPIPFFSMGKLWVKLRWWFTIISFISKRLRRFSSQKCVFLCYFECGELELGDIRCVMWWDCEIKVLCVN